MKPERWQEIQRLFDAVVEFSADEQLAYLQENCGGDSNLIEEVMALVNNANVDDTGLQQAIQESADQAVHGPDRIGKMLGPIA